MVARESDAFAILFYYEGSAQRAAAFALHRIASRFAAQSQRLRCGL
jgi:hypothetical protein